MVGTLKCSALTHTHSSLARQGPTVVCPSDSES